MKFKYLGNTGLQISELCFGTMSFGGDANQTESSKMYHMCRENGINFFDCANSYSKGKSEEILGKLIQTERKKVIISSKLSNPLSKDINEQGGNRRHIINAVNDSLKRLKTDYIDILFMHRWDNFTPIDETLRGLEDIVRAGKVIYLGASNYSAWQIAQSIATSKLNGWSKFDIIQPMYNLVKRQAEVEIFPLAQNQNLGVVSYSPIGGGLLSGKYSVSMKDKNGRLSVNPLYKKRYNEKWVFKTAEKLSTFAKILNVHPTTLALSWVMANKNVTAPIIGARNILQLKPSLAATKFTMTDIIYKQLSDMSPTPPPATDRLETQN